MMHHQQLMMMHHQHQFGYKKLSSPEDILWINAWTRRQMCPIFLPLISVQGGGFFCFFLWNNDLPVFQHACLEDCRLNVHTCRHRQTTYAYVSWCKRWRGSESERYPPDSGQARTHWLRALCLKHTSWTCQPSILSAYQHHSRPHQFLQNTTWENWVLYNKLQKQRFLKLLQQQKR